MASSLVLIPRPRSSVQGLYRVIRGGSWMSPERHRRSGLRGRFNPMDRIDLLGFRVILRKRG